MAYTPGTVHNVSGTGEIAVSAPVGLRWGITAHPAYLAAQPGTPLEWRNLGRFSVGNDDGDLPAVELRHLEQLEYPLPDSLTRLSYTLANGVSASVTELVGSFDSGGGDPAEVAALQAQVADLQADLADAQAEVAAASATIIEQQATIEQLQGQTGAPAGPLVSNIAVTHTATTLTVTWDTDIPADSQLEYGGSAAYGQLSAYAAALVSAHSVTVTGLQPQTTYHARPRSSAPYTGLGADQVLTTDADPTLLYSGSLVAPAPGSNSVYTTDGPIDVADWPIVIAVHNDAAAGGGTLTGGTSQCTGNGVHIAGSFITEIAPGATWDTGPLDYSIASCDSPLMVTCNADGVHAIPWTVTIRRAS